MTLVNTETAPLHADRRARQQGVKTERRGRERRRGEGRVNRVAPRTSRLQFLGALCTTICLSGVSLLLLGTHVLARPMPWAGLLVLGGLMAMAVLALIMGCIEQRLIEIRLELMMLNGGQRRSDRSADDRQPA